MLTDAGVNALESGDFGDNIASGVRAVGAVISSVVAVVAGAVQGRRVDLC